MQDELANTETQGAKQLVLGFDAGCFTCSDLATRIEDRVGEKLAVRNLRDPELQGWRERVLGEDAKWAPTLFEAEGDEVKAWTGWKMGWALSRAIGPTATWRVMQALGEVGAAPRIEESALVGKLPEKAADAVVGMSRGRFLKGVGGAAVAMSVLSGTDLLAAQAGAARRKKSPYDVVGGRKITGGELARIARQVGSSVDVKNLVGNALSTPAKVRAAKPTGFLSKLRNGSAARVIVYQLPGSAVLSYAQYNRPPEGRSASRAVLSRGDTRRRRRFIYKASEGGKLWRVDNDARSRTGDGTSPRALGGCPPIGPKPPGSTLGGSWQKKRVCCDIDTSRGCISSAGGAGLSCWTCYATAAAGGSAGAVVPACLACFFAGLGASGCCEEYRYVWVYCYGGCPA